jgi:hypothetical protein
MSVKPGVPFQVYCFFARSTLQAAIMGLIQQYNLEPRSLRQSMRDQETHSPTMIGMGIARCRTALVSFRPPARVHAQTCAALGV